MLGGLFIVSPILFFSFISDKYEKEIETKRAESEGKNRINYVGEPPAIDFFRSFLAPSFVLERKTAGEFELDDSGKSRIQPFHYLGTDTNGDDILLNIMRGARTAFVGSPIAVLVSLLIGVPLGIFSGFYGGKLKKGVDYTISVFTTLPKLIILIIIVATLGFNFVVIMITIGILASPKIMDIIQTKIQVLKEDQFIEAARELGISNYKIIFKHILWYNCNGIILIQLAYEFAEVILLESSLSYIGWGVRSQPSWGKMAANGMDFIFNQQYWMLFFPCLFIILSILGFHLIGDGSSRWLNNRQIA